MANKLYNKKERSGALFFCAAWGTMEGLCPLHPHQGHCPWTQQGH